MSQTIAVTGVTGFVGRHLVAELRRSGYRVRGLVRAGARAENLPEVDETIVGDLHNRSALEQLVQGVDGVIHVAGAIAGLNRDDFFNVNARGTAHICDAAHKAGVSRFILVSSLAARAPGLSHYAASKRRAEEIVQETFGPENGVIVRPPALYGPGDKATLILFRQLCARRAFISGLKKQAISWMYVDDLAKALTHLAGAVSTPSEPVELDDGTPGGYSWQALITAAGRAQGRELSLTLLPRLIVAPVAWLALLRSRMTGKADVLSPQKVHEIYHRDWVARGAAIAGWRPQVQFERGCAQTLKWYRENGWLPCAGDKGKKPANIPYGESKR